MRTVSLVSQLNQFYMIHLHHRPFGEQDRYLAETVNGEIVLSRENISAGSAIVSTNSYDRPIILKNSNGSQSVHQILIQM